MSRKIAVSDYHVVSEADTPITRLLNWTPRGT
jgi:hypothetical protein